MGSLLTGLYPIQHQLHRNFDRIRPDSKMLQEKAAQWGYRTFFFGGSPSILKKTGLSVGFDLFDDSTFLEKKTYFLDFKAQSEKFFATIQDDADPFLSIIHNSELESLNEGEAEISSFEKLDEKIFNFFRKLKKEKMWDENYVVVVGLQGESDDTRLNETPFSNLNSENTMVTLFVKPPRSKGDEGIYWKVDSAINLADLGLSLQSTLTAGIGKVPFERSNKIINNLSETFPLLDVSETWIKPGQSLAIPQRRILVEAAEPWSTKTSLRFAVLSKNLTYIENDKSKVFNALNDGLESIDISSQQKPFVLETDLILEKIRKEKNILSWKNFKSEWQDWVVTNHEYWSKPNSRSQLFNQERDRLNQSAQAKSQPLSALLQRYLIQNKRLQELKIVKSGSAKVHPMVTNEKLRETFFESAKLQSLNMALENIWGLWIPDKKWIYSDFILEIQ